MHVLTTFILSSISSLIQLYSEKYRLDNLGLTLNELEKDDNLPRIKIYDFIVVGGGGAGCVIARRLSKYYNVLLLEAGGTPPPAADVPFLTLDVIDHPSINYKYTSIPQLHASLALGGILSQPEGKMLGGPTSHNTHIYNRGHPLDYNNWGNITNDHSWDYKNVLKYFKKSENYIRHKFQRYDVEQHGHLGLMAVETFDSPILSSWFETGAELGYKTTTDPNGPQIESFSAVAVTLKNGRRVSSYTAFIKPIEKFRKKLRIERYSHVSQVLINEYKRAYGVAYTRHKIPQIAHASKEVIISCGTFGSPILLIKSGIGPSSILKNAEIPLVMDLPVGTGYCEHAGIFLPVEFNDLNIIYPLGTELNENSLFKYFQNGKGILAEPLQLGQAFVISSIEKKQENSIRPDLHILIQRSYKLHVKTSSLYTTLLIQLGKSKCEGVISLNTTAFKLGIVDNEKLTIIDTRLLNDPTHVDILLEGIKFSLKIIENTTTFQKLGGRYEDDGKHPNCLNFQFRSGEYWQCYIYQMSKTAAHATSSCKMGYGQNDKFAVLDSRFNVIGISNLKVVDASVMPVVPNTNTAAPVIMIAEKASHEILKYWKLKSKTQL